MRNGARPLEIPPEAIQKLRITSGLTEVLTPRKSEPRPQSEVRGFSEMGQNLDGEACKAS